MSGPSGTLTPAISRLPAASCLYLTVSTFIGVLPFFAAEVPQCRRERGPLSAVSCALVGDVADVVRIDTLRSTAITAGWKIGGKEAVDPGVRHQVPQSCEAALRL